MNNSAIALARSDKDFRWYWGGQSLAVVGTQIGTVALPLVAVLTLDAGAAGVASVATAGFLPNLIFPLLIGHWLEGRRKRRIMIWSDLARAGLLAIIPVAFVTGSLSVPLLVVVAFAVGTASVIFEIGAFAHLPTLVPEERLGAANQAVQGSATVAQVGGPGLGGLLVQALGPSLTIIVHGTSYLFSAVGIARVRRPEPRVEADSERRRIVDGVRILLVNPYLRALTTHASIYNLAAQIFLVNLVIWLVQDRNVSPGGYGLALGAGGVGAFAGTLLALRLAGRLGYGRAFAASLTLSCGIPLLIAAQPFSGAALGVAVGALLLVSGMGLGSANVLSITLRQTVIPRNQLARTNGGYRMLMYGSIPIGSALGGVLGEALGSQAGVAIGTVGFFLSAIPMFAGRVRRLHDPRDARTLDQGVGVWTPAV